MKLLAVTYGTEGDSRPMAALCRALMDAGHDVRLLADAGTLGAARALDVPHAALSGDMKEELKSLVAEGKGVNAAVAGLARIANAQARNWMEQVAGEAAGCDAIIVAGLTAFVGMSVAEGLGIPLIAAGMIPISPTRAFASPFIPPGRLPPALNRASHHLVNGLLWLSFRKAVNQARKSVLGMGPRHRMWKGLPTLYGISPSLLPLPPDWPDNVRLCGQWLSPAASWSPPPALQAFLDEGEPPVYLGFGSMVGFDREAVLGAFVKALEGRRVLLCPGWAGVDEAALPRNVFVIGNAPHDRLFPHVSLAIHHGGSGTAHSAVRAGIPSVVLPFAGDQCFWGRQLFRLGVAGRPLSRDGLRPDAIRHAVGFAESADARRCAAALGERMSREDGAVVAVREIESMLGGSGAAPGAVQRFEEG